MSDGFPDFIQYDEANGAPLREVIAVDEETGRSVAVRFPASWDLGEALPEGHVVAFDGGTEGESE